MEVSEEFFIVLEIIEFTENLEFFSITSDIEENQEFSLFSDISESSSDGDLSLLESISLVNKLGSELLDKLGDGVTDMELVWVRIWVLGLLKLSDQLLSNLEELRWVKFFIILLLLRFISLLFLQLGLFLQLLFLLLLLFKQLFLSVLG